MDPQVPSKSSPYIPVAIVAGFALIALAIFFTGGKQAVAPDSLTNASGTQTMTSTPRPIDSTDYIRGNPNAPILIVEYSDYDCPFCKQYHTSLVQIMDEYGVTGRVAWVYRQFPIAQLHPNSPKVSEAALCVGSIGGNEAFWKFSDLIFEERDIEEMTNVVALPDYAVEVGVKKEDYIRCMEDKKMEEVVKKSIEDAFNIGARGTPYTVIMVGTEQAVINGNQSYDTIKGIIENLLQQLDGNFDPSSATSTPAR
ncbi:MAG TPA: thioredoxin domain-containing protein [Candidatus Paceibacterota bacterium]